MRKMRIDRLIIIIFRCAGRADPIPFEVKNDSLGLGKANLDHTVIEATVSQRRDLDSERLLRETEEQRRAREVRPLVTYLPQPTTLIHCLYPRIR